MLNERGLQNQDLANERGTLCVDAILRKDYHTKPGKIGLLLQNPPHICYRSCVKF